MELISIIRSHFEETRLAKLRKLQLNRETFTLEPSLNDVSTDHKLTDNF